MLKDKCDMPLYANECVKVLMFKQWFELKLTRNVFLLCLHDIDHALVFGGIRGDVVMCISFSPLLSYTVSSRASKVRHGKLCH